MTIDLHGSSAIVTGGASGIGRATARRLARLGSRVIVADVHDGNGPAAAAEIGGVFVHVDVTDTAQIILATDTAMEQGPLRVLVNCAGTGWSQPTVGSSGMYESALDLDAVKRVIATNLTGTIDCVRIAASAMSRNQPLDGGERGAIVNIGSVAAFDGPAGLTAYVASKAGVAGMTLSLARDLAATGIRVNCVAPGMTDTRIFGRGEEAERYKQRLAGDVPFPPRLASAEEIASAIVECVTNGYINGATLRVDGALRMTSG